METKKDIALLRSCITDAIDNLKELHDGFDYQDASANIDDIETALDSVVDYVQQIKAVRSKVSK